MGWLSIAVGDEEVGVSGDDPWDIMSAAIDEIDRKYREAWGRRPTLVELQYAFDFTVGGWEERVEEEI